MISATEALPGILQTSKMEGFATVVNGVRPLSIAVKPSILEVCGSLVYASG